MIRNFLKTPMKDLENCHEGEGTLKNVTLFQDGDFKTGLKFLNYTVLPAGTTIGNHTHGDDEELYIVLEGTGIMTVDGESHPVSAGDIIVNRPFGTHGLVNDAKVDLKILVFEVKK